MLVLNIQRLFEHIVGLSIHCLKEINYLKVILRFVCLDYQ